ncbi:MAG: hypothetical protein KBD63_05625, partial [Bacteriovoracaceae bacterium]|nr:hypothetical protein [Bacteriovoracaceae bacterium]
MKSKILPLFWLSLFSSFFTFTVWSKDESSLGLIESFSTLLDLEKNQNKKIRTTVSSNPKLFSEIKNFNHIQIEPWEWAGISLYTEKKYLEIAKKYPCAIYSLMDTKLLRSSYGKIFNIVAYADIPLTSQSQKNKREAFLISVEDYLATIYAKECQQNLTLKKDFSRINIINTLQKINFPEPKEEKDCQPILDKWMQDERLPYLCYFADLFSSSEYPTGPLSHLTQTPLKAEQEFEQRVDKAQELKKSISERNYFYIHNLCDHLLDANAFCGPYLNETYWTKVSQGVFPQEFSQALCSRRNNSNSLSNCLKNFKENPESCHALSFS